MTSDEMKRGRMLLSNATGGRWELFRAEELSIVSEGDEVMAVVDRVCGEDDEAYEQAEVDAEFICWLRNHAAELIESFYRAAPPTAERP